MNVQNPRKGRGRKARAETPKAADEKLPTDPNNPRKRATKKASIGSPERADVPVPTSSQLSARGGGEGKDRVRGADEAEGRTSTLADTILLIRELAYKRKAMIKGKVRIGNMASAEVRRALGFTIDMPEKERERLKKKADDIVSSIISGISTDDPLVLALAPTILTFKAMMEPAEKLLAEVEKEMEKLAKALPVWGFASQIKGFGAKGLAIIVGEAGDLSIYADKSKLWKRMGLAVMSGRRQGSPGKSATAEDWILHGYNKQRRSMSWQIADSFMKHQSQWTDKETGEIKKPAGPYGEIYMRKKVEYVARVEQTADLPKGHDDKWTPKRADMAARRYTEKCLLRDLRRAWREAGEAMSVVANNPMPTATLLAGDVMPGNPPQSARGRFGHD